MIFRFQFSAVENENLEFSAHALESHFDWRSTVDRRHAVTMLLIFGRVIFDFRASEKDLNILILRVRRMIALFVFRNRFRAAAGPVIPFWNVFELIESSSESIVIDGNHARRGISGAYSVSDVFLTPPEAHPAIRSTMKHKAHANKASFLLKNFINMLFSGNVNESVDLNKRFFHVTAL
jgi:hypothetical protein